MNAMGIISGVGADTHVIKVFTHAFTELAINVNDFIG